MPICLQCIPDFFAWTALEDAEEHRCYVEYKGNANTDPDCKHHWYFSFPWGRENSGVLEKYGEFDEENRRTIENCVDVGPLVLCLADKL